MFYRDDDLPTHLVDPTRAIVHHVLVPVYCSTELLNMAGYDRYSYSIGEVTCIDCISAVRNGGVRVANAKPLGAP